MNPEIDSLSEYVTGGDALPATMPSEPQVYWVVAGAVDVFLTRMNQDGKPGARHHVCRIEAGFPLVAAALSEAMADWRLLLVPLPGTRCSALDAGLAHVPVESESSLEAGLCEWLSAWLRAAKPGLAPTRYRVIEGIEPLELIAGDAAATATGNAWLAVESGKISLLGSKGDIAETGSVLCLPSEAWLVAAADARLAPMAFMDLLAKGVALQAVASTQSVLARVYSARLADAEARAGERVALRERTAGETMERALNRLAGVLDPGLANAEGLDTNDPVLAACRIVGRVLGISFPGLPRHVSDLPSLERLTAAVAAARVQKRRVALRGEWWKEDAGPLVAFLESGDPIALLPLRGGYEAIDPQTGARSRMDAVRSASLSPFAFSFFSVLPARKLTVMDLLRLGLSGRKKEIAAALGIAGLLGVLGLLTPIAIGYLFDRVIPEADRTQLLELTAALIGAALATACFALVRSETLLRLEGRVEATIQAAVWDRVLNLPVGFFRRYSAGDLAQRVNAVNEIHQQLSGNTLAGLLTALFSFLNLGLLFVYSPTLAVLALAMVLVAVSFNTVAAMVTLHRDRQLAEINGKLSGLVLQYLGGIAKLRVASAEARAFARWAERFTEARGLILATRRVQNYTDLFQSTFAVLATSVLFYVVGTRLLHSPSAPTGSGLTTGSFVAFTGAFAAFFINFIELGNTLLELLRIVPQVERAKPILETLPEVDPLRAHPGEQQGDIEVSNVVFRYQADGPAILDNVSFRARPGEFIAFVGQSGSGKSTLIRILLGFEKPEAGSVYYDHKDLSDIDLPMLRRQLGVVLQSGQLMPGDIYSNIVGAHQLTLDDAWEAAQMCGLDADIEAMPMGMHTVLGEGATTLSGGQRQRILIARAIVRRPRILIFDEATSALDNQTQALVSRSIERLKATRIVIAHRLSTIQQADRIFVMQQGKIVQEGAYSELMSQPGLFLELARRQLV